MSSSNSVASRILNGLAAILMALVFASSVCGFILEFTGTVTAAPLIFAFVIIVTSYFSDQYWPGIAISALGVAITEYYFVAPIRSFEGFSLLTAIVDLLMLASLSFLISYITMHIRRLEKLRSEAEQEKLRANILRAVSHDIRTPLTSIVGATSAILNDDIRFSEETKKQLMQDVQEDAKWLIQMTENFLMATRVDAQAQNPRHVEILEDMIGDVARKFRKQYPATSLSIAIPPEIIFVSFDVILIKHVLMNILENAVLHGKSTHIDVRVQVSEDKIVFTLENDGHDIDLQLFSSLLQNDISKYTDRSEFNDKRNIGIGMTVCYSIIKAHGGELFAENIEGGGVRFIFTLPREEEETGDMPEMRGYSSSRSM